MMDEFLEIPSNNDDGPFRVRLMRAAPGILWLKKKDDFISLAIALQAFLSKNKMVTDMMYEQAMKLRSSFEVAVASTGIQSLDLT
jgi:hypothetical protein